MLRERRWKKRDNGPFLLAVSASLELLIAVLFLLLWELPGHGNTLGDLLNGRPPGRAIDLESRRFPVRGRLQGAVPVGPPSKLITGGRLFLPLVASGTDQGQGRTMSVENAS